MSRIGPANVEPGRDAPAARSVTQPALADERSKSGWSASKLAAAVALTLAGIAVMADAWIDIAGIAWRDEESSHIMLVPLVAVWLVWARLDQLREVPVRPSWVGPVLIALGAVLNWWGFYNMTQVLFHGGAVLVAAGCFFTVVGHHVLWRLLPVFVLLGFLVPVPGIIRQQIALPLQTYTAWTTAVIYDAFAIDIIRNGNVLRFNGVDVAVAEACNGMRMVFALVLVTYAVAFATPLQAWVRLLVLGLTPLFAVACNVLRLLPTVWLYGYYPDTIAPVFHDLSGWVMIGVAWAMVTGVIALLRWLDLPVMQEDTVQTNSEDRSDNWQTAGHTATPSWVTGAVFGGVAVVLLGGIFIVASARPLPEDAEPYHAKVQAAVAELPRHFDTWTSYDTPVPEAAQKLLRPNAIVSRIYTNTETNRSATLVVVHCKDARDMIGHYPPACYPNSGWTQQDAQPRSWTVGGRTLEGMRYDFSFQRQTGTERMIVYNLLVLPNGAMVRNMDEVIQIASDYTRRFFGAAQIQVLTPEGLSETEREAIFSEVMTAAMPLIETLPVEQQQPTAGTSPDPDDSTEPDPVSNT